MAATLTETELLLVRRVSEAEGLREVLVVSHGGGSDDMVDIEAIIYPISLCVFGGLFSFVILNETKAKALCL